MLKRITVVLLGACAALIPMAGVANAGIETLLAGAIQGFLLATAGVAVTTATATTIATIAISSPRGGITLVGDSRVRT